jgi:anti-sigma B factor antagonist
MPQPPRRRFEVQTVEDVTIVFFAARRIVEEADIAGTFEQLRGLIAKGDVRKLVLDFRNVEFLSSGVLSGLIALHKALRSGGGRVILCTIPPAMLEVFKITSLDKVFTIKEDTKAALQEFGVGSDGSPV